MPQTIVIPSGIITMCSTDFDCPKCTCRHNEDDWYKKLERSKTVIVYIKCKGCKTKLGVTTDMMGDVRVWLKEEENNFKNLIK